MSRGSPSPDPEQLTCWSSRAWLDKDIFTQGFCKNCANILEKRKIKYLKNWLELSRANWQASRTSRWDSWQQGWAPGPSRSRTHIRFDVLVLHSWSDVWHFPPFIRQGFTPRPPPSGTTGGPTLSAMTWAAPTCEAVKAFLSRRRTQSMATLAKTPVTRMKESVKNQMCSHCHSHNSNASATARLLPDSMWLQVLERISCSANVTIL